ncbi:TPA: Zona occludens toxin, partial [Stenotrophomonas maltophilia]
AGGSTGEESKLKEVVKSQKAAIPAIAQAPGAQPATVVTKVVDTPKSKEKMPAGVQYILDMAANARARHAGWYGHRDIVEFRASGGGQVLDRFTTEQLWALGWSVKRTEFGVLLSAKGHEIIATTWPVDPFGEQSDSTTERIRAAAGAPVTSASETQPTTAAANGSTLIAVGKRPLGTFPETPPYQASF